jgi:putative two-component system response regulator
MNLTSAAPGNILVVDDTFQVAEVMRRMLVDDGHTVEVASDGESALASVGRHAPDIILLDVKMHGLDGFEVCRRLKSDPATRLTPVVLVTTLSSSEDRVMGMEVGADDFLTKPVDPAELRSRVRTLLRVKRYTDELDSAEAVIIALANTVEARDPNTIGHCARLARYATALGEFIGLDEDDLSVLYRGGVLHDVGKIAVPDSVLLKPGPLTAEEFEFMKRHTIVGDELCADLRALRRVRPIVRQHHERQDGSGYPDGLAGDKIVLVAQIVGIVDVYDALTTSRPYKPALDPDAALDCLVGEARHGLHQDVLVEAFAALRRTGIFEEHTPATELAHRYLKGTSQ